MTLLKKSWTLNALLGITCGIASFFVTKYLRKLYKWYRAPLIRKSLFDLVGNTPLIYLKSLSKETGCEIFAKMEYLNPGGSMKDRAAKQIILDGEEKKLLKEPGDLICEGTSGSTGISLALLANHRGYKCKFFFCLMI